MEVPIEISARHVHLSAGDIAALFGDDYQLKPLKMLSQPGQFSAAETVRLTGPKGSFERLRIIGPARQETQVELSATDCRTIGLTPAVRLSGEIDDSPGGVKLTGPRGEITLKKGVIVAKRHLHLSPAEAGELGLKHGDNISLKVKGERAVTFHEVVVRSRQNVDKMSFMLDTDEANAAAVRPGETAEIIKE